MNGGLIVEAVLALVAVGLLVWNIVRLSAAARLLSDSRAGRLVKVKAVIRLSGKISGRMVGASRERLSEGQTFTVLVSERSPALFAVDERQIKSAFTACVVVFAVSLILAGFLGFLAVTDIIPH